MCHRVAASLLVEAFDNLGQIVQTQVDVLGFLQSLPIDARLTGPLTAREIDQLQLGHGLHILAHLLRL